MNRNTHRFAIADLVAFSCLLTSCAHTRHVLVEFTGSTARIKSVGRADPQIAADLFRPHVWLGPRPWDAIPAEASPCGVLIVTHGSDTMAMPLLSWSATNSVPQFGCDGPTSLFAVRESTQTQLFSTIRNRITGKVNKTNGE